MPENHLFLGLFYPLLNRLRNDHNDKDTRVQNIFRILWTQIVIVRYRQRKVNVRSAQYLPCGTFQLRFYARASRGISCASRRKDPIYAIIVNRWFGESIPGNGGNRL